VTTSGTLYFHYYYGVPVSGTDSLTLTGDNYTDLIMSNMIAGVMYGHLIKEISPGIQFNEDYLYGSIFGQLLQENIATGDYVSTGSLVDPSGDQQSVMGTGEGGPYQINNYAVDMVGSGTPNGYTPAGFQLINYVAIQKNIGFTMAEAPAQHGEMTPASFNNKYYGPMLAVYFHINDYRAVQYIGGSSSGSDGIYAYETWAQDPGWTPAWQPYFDNMLTNFTKNVSGGFLDIVMNVAYNEGYYGGLFQESGSTGAIATSGTIQAVDNYGSVWSGTNLWGNSSTYVQYPYQVRSYIDQLFDKPSMSPNVENQAVTASNHVAFNIGALETVFGNVFQTLAYVDGSGSYTYISGTAAATAFDTALQSENLTTSDTLDLSNSSDRTKIFSLIDAAITNLETDLNLSFSATTQTQL
jgi:hypothetical protein